MKHDNLHGEANLHCEAIEDQLADYLGGTLNATARRQVDQHLAACADCRSAVAVWDKMAGLTPERPSVELRARFQDMLWANMDTPSTRFVKPKPMAHPIWRWAMAAALVAVGFLGGRFAQLPTAKAPDEVASLRGEVRDLREAVVVSMLRQTSASERLKGVLTSTTLDRPDPEVTAALVETLRHDPNVNVRLSAVDALKRMSGDQTVRRSFAESLVASDSPLVQIALIDALMENPAVARDPQAANAFRTVALAKQGENVVKQRARLALERLEKRED